MNSACWWLCVCVLTSLYSQIYILACAQTHACMHAYKMYACIYTYIHANLFVLLLNFVNKVPVRYITLEFLCEHFGFVIIYVRMSSWIICQIIMLTINCLYSPIFCAYCRSVIIVLMVIVCLICLFYITIMSLLLTAGMNGTLFFSL